MKLSKEYAEELITLLQQELDDYECGYRLLPSGYPFAKDGFIRVIREWADKLILDVEYVAKE